MIELYLIRHPFSRANELRIAQDKHDPLTELGKEQAEVLAQFTANIPFDVIFSSDQERASFLAKKIAAHHPNIPLHFTSALGEFDAGPFVGQFLGDIDRTHPDIETAEQVHARAYTYVQEACTNCADDAKIAVVTHGGVIKTIIPALTKDAVNLTPFLYNTSITKLVKENAAQPFFTIKYFNELPHLEEHEHLITPKETR